MKKLHEIVKEKNELQLQLKKLMEDYNKKYTQMSADIGELGRLEDLALSDISIDKVQVAERILRVEGDPYAVTDDVSHFKTKTIAEKAIIDISNSCPHLRGQYFGNKRYSIYYQESDHPYGYGPSHGSIVDRIGLKNEKHKLTDDEKDACIYYLKNYNKIKSSHPANL